MVGSKLRLQNGMTATVTAVDGDKCTLDANHDLAGKTLVFDIEVCSTRGARGMGSRRLI